MAIVGSVNVDIKFHDPFPRADYIALCAREGRVVTDDGYARWRDTCERLSGEMSVERRLAKLGEQLQGSFATLGVASKDAAGALNALGSAFARTDLLARDDR
jgi:hypothetical protein